MIGLPKRNRSDAVARRWQFGVSSLWLSPTWREYACVAGWFGLYLQSKDVPQHADRVTARLQPLALAQGFRSCRALESF